MSRSSHVDQFRAVIQDLRTIHLGVIGKSGRRLKGPRFYAVTKCSGCKGIGMTSSAQPIKKRWRCRTCGEPKIPVWADGPTPEEDEIYEAWAATR